MESARRLLELENAKTIVPLDSMLGIDKLPFKISMGMMLDIAYWAVKMDSYQDAEDFFLRNNKIRISDDSIREVVNYVGRIVYDEDCRVARKCLDEYNGCQLASPYDRDGVLYLQTDGAALNTRTKDENNSTWRENKLGLAFSSDNIRFWKNKKGTYEHRILKREYVSLVGAAQDFKYHFLALAQRNGYGRYKKTVILSDGATWIRNIKEEMFPDAQQILDLYHLKENTYEFAKNIFKNDEAKYDPWAKAICDKLENGKWQEVLRELEPYKDIPARPGSVNLYTYISNNRSNINYPSYKAEGLFVGSGAIESGNKVVLQSRLKLPGMRWNIDTAQYVLSLKAKLESGLWDSYVVPLIYKIMGSA